MPWSYRKSKKIEVWKKTDWDTTKNLLDKNIFGKIFGIKML